MPIPDLLQSLDTRRSTPSRQLGPPGPDDATLLRMLQTAVRVPDHGKLVPFRFLRLRGDARHALGEALVARALDLDPQASTAALEKDRARFSHAPLIVTVIARLDARHKVPEQEQLLSAGCVCFALLQAAQALGFGAQWLTGWIAYDRPFLEGTLGLTEDEQLVGTIAIGTALVEVPDRERPDPGDLLSDWSA